MPENIPPEMDRKIYLMAQSISYHIGCERFWKHILSLHLIVDIIIIINYILFSSLFVDSYPYKQLTPTLIDTEAIKQHYIINNSELIIFNDFAPYDFDRYNDEFGPV